MSGELAGPEPGGGVPPQMRRAMVARAEAVVLLGDVRADLTRWSQVLAEVELALQPGGTWSLDEHAGLAAARNRLFDVMAEISALADPYSVWAAVSPDEASP